MPSVVLTLIVPDHGEDDVLSRINDKQRTATAAVTVTAESEVFGLVLKSDPVFHVQFGKVRFGTGHPLRSLGADDPQLQSPKALDEASMRAGIALVHWFKAEARRVYAMLSESSEVSKGRTLLEWIERKGGSVTAREVQQGHRQYHTPQAAEGALEALVKAGCGYWEPTPAGRRGQPTRRFNLSTVSTVYGIAANPQENGNTVDVVSVDAPETHSNEEDWGEI